MQKEERNVKVKAGKMRDINIREEHVITKDTVLPMSNIIATTALKSYLSRAYSAKLLNMYYDLVNDILCPSPDRPFSDGYDLVMTAASYLCEHMGESLNDMTGVMVSGKKATVMRACYSIVTTEIQRGHRLDKRRVDAESDEIKNMSVPFELPPAVDETERQHDAVNMLIQRMHLTDLQLKVLNFYFVGALPSEIVRALNIKYNSLLAARHSIQHRYIKYIIQGKVHYKDRRANRSAL